MVDVDGAVQVSKARPLPIMPVTAEAAAALDDAATLDDCAAEDCAAEDCADVDCAPEDCAVDRADVDELAVVADLAAADDAPTVISDRLPADGFDAAADPPGPAALDELDTWALVLETVAPARIERSPGSFVP
jgi:hypothetical protein